MAEITIVYWRDIPAQLIVGRGRGAVKRPLPERFEQAIDRAAMRAGLIGTDAYLSEWRRAEPYDVAGDAEEVARAEAARIEATYDQERIRALVENEGWAAKRG
ncbi:MAG TPA: virulence factor [Paracoccaceae bacterium]|nr:virulence factor [Paracoccaceae bacterium]